MAGQVERYASAIRAADAQIERFKAPPAVSTHSPATADVRGVAIRPALPPRKTATTDSALRRLSPREQKALLDSLTAGALIEVEGVGECWFVARAPKARRGLLVLLDGGSFEAVEESLFRSLRRRAFVAGDKVMLPRKALARAFPLHKWRDGSALPKDPWADPSLNEKADLSYTRDTSSYGVIGIYTGGHLDVRGGDARVPQDMRSVKGRDSSMTGRDQGKVQEDALPTDLRGKVLKVGVFVNKQEVERGSVVEKVQYEARKGQPEVRILAEIQVDSATMRTTPVAQQAPVAVTRPVDIALLLPVTEVMNQKFREAVRQAARASVSAYTRAQLQANSLFEETALHAAAARGDADELAKLLRGPRVSADSVSSKGCTVLGNACRCEDQQRSQACVQILLRQGANPELEDRPCKAPPQIAWIMHARQLIAPRPLHIAAMHGNLAAIRLLIAAKSDPLSRIPVLSTSSAGRQSLRGPGEEGLASALHVAAACAHPKCVEALLCAAAWGAAVPPAGCGGRVDFGGRIKGCEGGTKMKLAVDAMVRISDAHMPLAATQAGGRACFEAGADALGCCARSGAPGTRPMSAPPRRTSFEPPPRRLQGRDKRVSIALSGGGGGAWQQGGMGETGLRHEIESRGKVGREQEAQARLWAAQDAVMRQDSCGRTGGWRECMSVSRHLQQRT